MKTENKMKDFDKPSIYLNALKSKPLREIKISTPERRQAFISQKGKCLECKKDLNPVYCKYLRDPLTRKIKILCSSCAIKTPK